MAAPLGGDVGDSGAHTINAKNVDGMPPRRRCRSSGSVHYQHKKMLTVGPMRGVARNLGALTINVKNVDGSP
jgi:hypothetical protein